MDSQAWTLMLAVRSSIQVQDSPRVGALIRRTALSLTMLTSRRAWNRVRSDNSPSGYSRRSLGHRGVDRLCALIRHVRHVVQAVVGAPAVIVNDNNAVSCW